MNDVVFITPNRAGNVREEPVGTLLLATILKSKGISSRILSFFSIGSLTDFDAFLLSALELIAAERPRIVSFYTRCDTYHISITLAQRCKERFEDITIIFGGPQADLCAQQTVTELPFVDYVCCGEGENTVYPFFRSLLDGKPDLTVPGLVYVREGQAHSNPRPSLIHDLDTLPLVDFSLLHFVEDPSANLLQKLFPVDVGRGCPFACSYCSTSVFWQRNYRMKSAERIIAEVQRLHDHFGATQFNFEHDMFTLDRKKIIHICSLLKQLDFPITWRCSARIDCLDKELIDIMYDAGLRIIFVGIETGSARMQKLLHKNLKLDGAAELLQYADSKEIYTIASFIYGLPEEEPDDVSRTIALCVRLMRLRYCYVQTHLCAFLPGTEIAERYHDELVPMKTTSNVTGDVAVEACSALIQAHPQLFMQYREYHSALRDELAYLPVFLGLYHAYDVVYTYITEEIFSGNYIAAYRSWRQCNEAALNRAKTEDEAIALLRREDAFALAVQDPTRRALVTEVQRFILWKDSNRKADSEVFGFCVDDLLSGKPLTAFGSGLSMATTVLQDGKSFLKYQISHR